MTVQAKNGTADTHITHCSDVYPNQQPKQHSSSRNKWAFVHGHHLIHISSNEALCSKLTVIHIEYMRGIKIHTSSNKYGTENERHNRT